MFVKHEFINFFRNPAVIVVVLLPIFMSKIMMTVMEIAEAQLLMLSIWILFAQIMIGIMLMGPDLIEERETKTIDALLCTPLNYAQIIIGKALPVIVFSLLSQLIILLINANVADFDPLILIPMGLGTIIFAEIGIVIGLLVSSSKNGSAISAVVFVCLFLVSSVYNVLPEWSYNFFYFIPSISLVELMNGILNQNSVFVQELVITIFWVVALSIYVFAIATRRSYRKG